jgi:hypothetical protein
LTVLFAEVDIVKLLHVRSILIDKMVIPVIENDAVLLESDELEHFVAEFVESELGDSLEDPDPLETRVQVLAVGLNLCFPQIREMLLGNRDVLDLSLSHKPNVRDVAKTIVHIRAA